MKINVENMNQFIKEFEFKVFPTIKGSDGQGIERLRAIVEKKKMDVADRKLKRLKNEIFGQIINSPRIVNKISIENVEDYQKIKFKEVTYKFDIKFDSKESTNKMSLEGFKNELAHMVSDVNITYSESKYKIA
jgi:hypothetical protein